MRHERKSLRKINFYQNVSGAGQTKHLPFIKFIFSFGGL